MNRDGCHRPGQALRENESDVAPGAHVAHDRHPAEPLEEKLTERAKIGDSFDSVGQEFHVKTLFRYQASDEQVVRRPIFDSGVATEGCEMLSRGDDGLAKSEFNAVELARDEDAGIKITDHTDGLELLKKGVFVGGDVEAGDGADFWIAERRDDGTQIVWPHANVAVVDDQNL